MNPDLLKLTQWLSPAFPLGSFAYSHGLEQAMVAGHIHDGPTLTSWIEVLLKDGSGRMDAVMICRTMQGQDMTDTATALAASKERLEEAQAQGRAFARTVSTLLPIPVEPAPLPVALGHAARQLSLSDLEVTSLYLHSFVSNLVSAAVRFVPLGQTTGQTVLDALHPVILAVATAAQTTNLDDIGSAAFGGDMAAILHETLDVRIFKT